MPYQAQGQSLRQVGGPNPDTRPRIDVASAIDAVTGGAAGLIHQAYTRRAQEHEMQRQDQQLQLEREREDRTREHEARMELASGILRGGTSVEREPAAPAPTAAAPTIRDAFDGASLQTAPSEAPSSSLTTPVQEGSLGNVPRIRVTSTPDRYDPDQDRTRVRTLDAIGARGAQASSLEELRQQGRMAVRTKLGADRTTQIQLKAALDAQRSAAHDGRVAGMKREQGAKGMTGNAQFTARSKLAEGLIGSLDGDFSGATDFLNSDEGKEYRDAGLTQMDLHAAAGRYHAKVASQDFNAATGDIRSSFSTPQAAVTKVRETRGLVNRAPAARTPAPRAPSAAVVAPPAAAATGNAVNESTLSDADLWEHKRGQGLNAQQATQYVRSRKH